MKAILYCTLMFLLVGCSQKEYRIVEPKPVLALSVIDQTCEEGRAARVTLSVSQQGQTGPFSLSALILEGAATIDLDGRAMATTGAWTALQGSPAKLTITPSAVSDLHIALHAQAPSGYVSDTHQLRITVRPASGITSEATCEMKIVNPDPDTIIPITLSIQAQDPAEKFTVVPTITKGKGRVFYNGYVVSGTELAVDAQTVLFYNPEVIGEQIIQFDISAGSVSTTARAYMNIYKQITVTSDIQDCFTITGAGEHDIEGKEITLQLVNNATYNFEPAAWYDGDNTLLLSEQETYRLKLAIDCITDLHLRLKPRVVNITQLGTQSVPYQFVIMENGVHVAKTAYDYRMQFSADHTVSDPIRFNFTERRLNKSTLPPTTPESSASPAFDKGTTKSGYFWRTDQKFHVYLRQVDNPGFTFNNKGKYIESATTRYMIPANVTMQ